VVRQIGILLQPFMPGKAAELWKQVGGPGDLAAQRFASLMSLETTGWQVKKGEPLFPKEREAEARASA